MFEQLYQAIKIHYRSVFALFEVALIGIGLYLLYLLPRRIFADGDQRLFAVQELIAHGRVSHMSYSIVGPAFSIPFLLLGKVYQSDFWWSGQYNKIVFAAGLLFIYLLLKNHVQHSLLRKYILILIVASMFANNVTYFGGEVFTAICVGVGILAVVAGPSLGGWCAIVLGVVNTPASVVGLGTMLARYIFQNKRWRYACVMVIAVGLILAEAWIRRGSPFNSGYSNQAFSTPFLLGLFSILFSFGKGIFFFAPGLLLPIKQTLLKLREEMKLDLYLIYTLWIGFLVGLVLVYSPWWAWYGGWFWGPRFFLFASLPASFALAVRLQRPDTRLLVNLLTIGALALYVWVGIDGALFDQYPLGNICIIHQYSQEYLCHYVPQYSVLWRPFLVGVHLNGYDIHYVLYGVLVAVYLAIPLLRTMAMQTLGKVRQLSARYVDRQALSKISPEHGND